MRSICISLLVLGTCFISPAFAAGFGFISNPPVQVDATGWLVTGVSYQIQDKVYLVYAKVDDINFAFKDAMCVAYGFKKSRSSDLLSVTTNLISVVIMNSDLNVTAVYDNTQMITGQWDGINSLICER